MGRIANGKGAGRDQGTAEAVHNQDETEVNLGGAEVIRRGAIAVEERDTEVRKNGEPGNSGAGALSTPHKDQGQGGNDRGIEPLPGADHDLEVDHMRDEERAHPGIAGAGNNQTLRGGGIIVPHDRRES